jgi:hypothetical protein
MASTYTSSLQLQKIGNGEQSGTWGNTTNTNWDLVDSAIAGVINITMANADYVLSTANGLYDEARNMVLVLGGSNSALHQVVIPAATKMYLVVNNTGYSVTIGKSGGTLATVQNGASTLVYCDGSATYAGINTNSVTGAFSATGNISSGGTYYATQIVGSVSVASPGVVTLATTSSGLVNNAPVYFSLATGATLPTGLTAGTTYYVTNLAVGASTTFNLAATAGGSAINTTGSASTGSVTLVSSPYLAVQSTTTNYVNATGSITTNARFYPAVLTDASTAVEKVSSVAAISVNPSLGALNATQFTSNQTATFTIATSLVTVSNAVVNGQAVFFEGSSGATFPTGVSSGTTYYVVNSSGTAFQISTSVGGSAITMSGSQSGTFTGYFQVGVLPVSSNGYGTRTVYTTAIGTASISGTTMTVTGTNSQGSFAVGQTITGTGIASSTTITALGTGTGGAGTYTVSPTQDASSTSGTISGTTMTLGGTITGTFRVGQTISGTGVTAGTTITALGTGTGGAGTYFVSVSQTVSSATTISATVASTTVTGTIAPSGGSNGDIWYQV